MKVEEFIENIGAEFYAGVPDSQLRPLCDFLMDKYAIDPEHHIIAANEGNCVALAAGYHLATGKVPVVYMQNSGEGNIVNPVASLLNDKVYKIPMIFVVGWRGEPGVHDEPQHIFQGEITEKLLHDLGMSTFIVRKDTSSEAMAEKMREFRSKLEKGENVAFIIAKGALSIEEKIEYQNHNDMCREEVIQHIVKVTQEDPVISTTGKASRELFETRVFNKQSHKYDFLTVGSMGHSSSIALGIAINKPDKKVWCIDGDGAVLMHMGSMAVIGATAPMNFVHIVINNGAHETVGGMPTVAEKIDMIGIAKACGYVSVCSVDTFEKLDEALWNAKKANVLTLIEVKCKLGAREDLGRPTTTALENKISFMDFLQEK